jgi:hypothetical protein
MVEVSKNSFVSISTVVPLVLILATLSTSGGGPEPMGEPIEVSLEPYVADLVTVRAITGSDTLKLILDTGGGATLIEPDVAGRLGLRPSGRGVGYRMSGEQAEFQYCPDVTLTIGGIPFTHESMAVWDLGSILPEGLPPVDGVLSLNTFQDQPFTLDLASKRLILETGQTLADRTKKMTRLRSRIATGVDGSELTVFLHGRIRDPGWFLLDSCNLGSVIAAPHLGPYGTDDSVISPDTWEAELALDGLPPAQMLFRTEDIIYDGVLSEEYMRQWVFTFDLASNGVWVSPAGDNPPGQ